jgi:hypothetical protein
MTHQVSTTSTQGVVYQEDGSWQHTRKGAAKMQAAHGYWIIAYAAVCRQGQTAHGSDLHPPAAVGAAWTTKAVSIHHVVKKALRSILALPHLRLLF